MSFFDRLYERLQHWFEVRHEALERQAKHSWLIRHLGLALFHTLWFYMIMLLSPLGWIFVLILLLLGLWKLFGINPV